jgi:hypothetical protein
MLEGLQFAWIAWRAWRQAKARGLHYRAVTIDGVPQLAVLVATGREAWRVTNLAVTATEGPAWLEQFGDEQETDEPAADPQRRH